MNYFNNYKYFLASILENNDASKYVGDHLNETDIDYFIKKYSHNNIIRIINLNKNIDWRQTEMHTTANNLIIGVCNGIKFYMSVSISDVEYKVIIIFENFEELTDFLDIFLKKSQELSEACIALTIDAKSELYNYDWGNLHVFIVNNFESYRTDLISTFKERLLLGVNNLVVTDAFEVSILENSKLLNLNIIVKDANQVYNVVSSCKELIWLNATEEGTYNHTFFEKICLGTTITNFCYNFKKQLKGYNLPKLFHLLKIAFIDGNLKQLELGCKHLSTKFDDACVEVLNKVRDIKFKSDINIFIKHTNLKKVLDIVNKNNLKLKLNFMSHYMDEWLGHNLIVLFNNYKHEYNSFILLVCIIKKTTWLSLLYIDIKEMKNIHKQKKMTLVKRLNYKTEI